MARKGESNNELVNAIMYLMWATYDMGDTGDENAEYLADAAGLNYDEDDADLDDVAEKALEMLVSRKSGVIPEFLHYYFTEDIFLEYILDDLVAYTGMEDTLNIIYDSIGNFPGGGKVKSELQKNVFDVLDQYSVEVAKVGYDIGHTYWNYVTNPVYGVKTNSAYTVGARMDDSKYVYRFGKDISSYYYQDAYMDAENLPLAVGYEFRVRSDRGVVFLDIFPFARMSQTSGKSFSATYKYAYKPIDTISVVDFTDQGIEDASREVAAWLDDHAEDAIEYWVE